jgi:hypothetical protein
MGDPESVAMPPHLQPACHVPEQYTQPLASGACSWATQRETCVPAEANGEETDAERRPNA